MQRNCEAVVKFALVTAKY